MYGWSGGFAGMGRTSLGSATNPVAGVDYDPALLGGANVYPAPSLNPATGLPASLDWMSQPMADVASDWSVADWTAYFRDQSRGYTPAANPTFTSWLNENAGKVAAGVGGVFAIVLLTKAGR